MTFLAIILALVVVQAWGSGGRVQEDEWFARLQTRIAQWNLGALASLAIAILVPVVLALLILGTLEDILFGLPWIAVAVVLLLYSFGRGDFHELLARYRSQCRSGNFEAAYLESLAPLSMEDAQAAPDSATGVHALVQRSFFYEGYQRWFGVIFYFVLLGPAAALGYRLLQLCRHSFEPQLAERWLAVLDWVPARLLAATFALAGDLVRCRDPLLQAFQDVGQSAADLLYSVGTPALGLVTPAADEGDAFGAQAAAECEESGHLLSRSAVCWVAAVALFVILD